MANSGKARSKGLSNQALKEFRSKVAKLKKKHVVSKRVDARSQRATKYMLAKVRKFEDVLSGNAIAVKATKKVREKYTEAGIFPERGSFLIVPSEMKGQRAKIKKGRDLVEITTPLKWGEEREIVLPFKPVNMIDLANKIAADPNFDGLKKADEQFAFRLFGHNSIQSFPDAAHFSDYVRVRYQHLFQGRTGQQAIRHLSVIRFKNYADTWDQGEEGDKIFSKRRRVDATGRNSNRTSGRRDTFLEQRRVAAAARKKKLRAQESESDRTKRLADNRARASAWRKKKRDEKGQ